MTGQGLEPRPQTTAKATAKATTAVAAFITRRNLMARSWRADTPRKNDAVSCAVAVQDLGRDERDWGLEGAAWVGLAKQCGHGGKMIWNNISKTLYHKLSDEARLPCGDAPLLFSDCKMSDLGCSE